MDAEFGLAVREREGLDGTPIIEYSIPGIPLICPYFHQRFITANGRYVLCEGRFGEFSELVRLDLVEHSALRLTTGGAAVYVGDLHGDGRRFFTTSAGSVFAVDIMTGEQERIADVPSAGGYETTGSVHLNADGSRLLMSGNRQHASDVKEGRVWCVDVSSGHAQPVIDRPFQIGHVQTSTTDPDLCMYCHETGGASAQRMWRVQVDGNGNRALFDVPGHPWVTHEAFCGDGSHIVFIRHCDGIGVILPDNSGFVPYAVAGAWHPGPDTTCQRVVFDTHRGELGLLWLATGRTAIVSSGELSRGHHMHPRFFPDDRHVIWTAAGQGEPVIAVADISSVEPVV